MQEIKKINLSLEWKDVVLKDVLSEKGYIRGPFGSALKRSEMKSEGIPVYEQQNAIYDNRIFRYYIDDEKYQSLKRFTTLPNDLIISCSGTIGKVSIIKENDPKGIISQALLTLRVNNELIHPEFLKYFFTSYEGYNSLVSRSTGSVQVNISKRAVIEEIPIKLPPLDIQEKIVYYLKLIDKKIEINEEINKNLEEQLLRIFDSWFVKFESSNEFSDSKLGLIPKGWKIDYLGSKKSCSIIGSGIDEFDNSKIYIATADVDNSIIISNNTLITMDDKPNRANMQPIVKSIWFAKMIDSRKLIMIDDYCSDLLNNYIFSTGFCGLKCVDKYFYYLWAFLLTDNFDVMKNNFCTGTTMQAINNKDTKLIEFVLPDDKIINQFNVIAKPMFKKIYYNSLEIEKLQRLRDTLLPKLMSGEIDVSKINCDLELKYNYMKYLFNQIHTPMSKSVV